MRTSPVYIGRPRITRAGYTYFYPEPVSPMEKNSSKIDDYRNKVYTYQASTLCFKQT
jgi:hypothetical protein